MQPLSSASYQQKNELSSQNMWRGTNLLNDPLNTCNGIGVCLYEAHVCDHKITYMLRLAGSTLMFGISCCVFVHTPSKHAERCTSICYRIDFELKELKAHSSIVQSCQVLNLHAGWEGRSAFQFNFSLNWNQPFFSVHELL